MKQHLESVLTPDVMPTTRAAEKNAATNYSDAKSEAKAGGSKYNIQDKTSSESKRLKKKTQQTIEDTLPRFVTLFLSF